MKAYLFSLAALAASGLPVYAELVSMPPEQLKKLATHVVTGKVVAVYQREEKAGDWRYTHYVAEVSVGGSEKGDGIKAGDLVYVRYHRRGWVGKGDPPPAPSGHRDLPTAGQSVRVYARKDAKNGGMEVVLPNGFETMKAEGKK